MRLVQLTLCLVLGLCGSMSLAGDDVNDIDDVATHQQIGILKIAESGNALPINAFCLARDGMVVAACGTGPGEVRIVNDEGEILHSWKLDVKPEAINVADDGTILVGGEGKLFRFDKQGTQLKVADSPHAEKLRGGTESLRADALKRLTRTSASAASRVEVYERIIDQLQSKADSGKLNTQEERMLELLPKTLVRLKEQAEAEQAEQEDAKKKGPSEEAIQRQINSLVKSKMRISSISSSGNYVFVATPALAGYGYDIWRLSDQFSDGQVIVNGLRGCCGQMDVQCCESGIFVAENSRHRVVRFDTQGAEITNWGKRDRTGEDGFTSCCNPMNVCFNSDGDVFTAESGTGRIKRFNTDGELVSYVGDVDLVPGCKNVSIAVSPDSSKVYMLDLTRNHIVIMQARETEPTGKTAAK